MRDGFENILLIKMSSMGDILHALPAACALRDFFPKSRISWLIDKRFVHLIEGHSSIDEIIRADAPAWVEQIRYRGDIPRGLLHFRIASELKRRQFDSVFDLQNLFRSALLAWSTGAKTRIGLNDWREGAPMCYTKVARPTHRHVIRHYLSIIEAVTGPVNKIRFDLPIRTEAKERISALLDQFGLNEGRPFVVIAPKSSQTFKDWPSDRFAQVVRYLRQRWTLPTVLVGASKDEETCRQIAIDSEASPRLILGRPLDQLIALLDRPRLVIGLDSGPTHLAATLGKPVVSIFGPTDPHRSAPWGSEHLTVHRREACRACQLPFTAPRGIPGIRHTCLTELTVESVIEAIDREMTKGKMAA
jgi:lipopolysaccharide heptosyltransferase I